MPDDNPFLMGYYRLVRRFCRIVGAWPMDQDEKDDQRREEAEKAAWREFYDTEIAPRLDWMDRGT